MVSFYCYESPDPLLDPRTTIGRYLILWPTPQKRGYGLLISKKRITFLFGIGGRGIHWLSADWTDSQISKLIFAFFYRLYDPGHFGNASYVEMVHNFRKIFVE